MNRKLRLLLIPLIAVGLLFSYPIKQVDAQTNDYELNSVSGIWTATDGGADIMGLTSNEVRWGRTYGDGEKSGLRFIGSNGEKFDEGELFLLGTLTHMNTKVQSSTGANKATLQVTLDFQHPSIDPNPTFTFDFDIEETRNVWDYCESFQQSDIPCDDRITFPVSRALETFQIGEKFYTLEIMGFIDNYSPNEPLGDPEDAFITEENKDNVTFLLGRLASAQPDIQLIKKTNGQDITEENQSPYLQVGDPVIWTYDIRNIGNAVLTNVVIEDIDNESGTSIGPISCGITGSISLQAGDSMVCTASGTAQTGQYQNDAIVTGDYLNDMGSGTVSSSDSSWYFGVDPDIELTKMANPTSFTDVDDVITYTFVAKNTGNVTLTGVDISDPMVGLKDWSCDLSDPVTLAPTGELTCTAKYKVTQVDIDTGQVLNTAEACGQEPTGERVTSEDDETVTGPTMNPDIELTKTVNPTTFTDVDDVITYTFVAKNTGNVTLTDVKIDDTGLARLYDWSCGLSDPVDLAPTNELTCMAKYNVTQADIDAGQVVNTAESSGQPPTGERIEDDDSAEIKKAAISLTKTADVPSYKAVGDVITYTFVATNTGNVELSTITITDTMSGLSDLDCGSSITLPTTLSPGASVSCKATYTVTQADKDADKIDNTARVTGKDPNDNEITAEDSETVDKIAISLTKTADPEVFAQVGEIITYTFVAENTGNLSLYNVTISDPLTGLSELDCGSTALPSFLGPDASVTCTGTYQITQSDIDKGFVENAASASGEDERGQSVEDDDDALVEGPKSGASIDLVKTADPEIYVAVGDLITYTFTATNDGLFTLSDVTITDLLPGLSSLSCSEPMPATLLPGESITCEATYRVQQADIDNGLIENTAEAMGTGSNQETVDDDDSAIVEGPKEEASIHLDKRAEPATYNAVGDKVVYTFNVTNNGIFTLTNVTVTDPLFSLNYGPIGTLDPGESLTYKYTYTITQADIEAKNIFNVATAMGYDPDDQPVSSTDDALVERPDPKKVGPLPTTGFAPNQITNLPLQPVDKAYTAYSEFWLEIPKLGVRVDIVGVPRSEYGWDVSWLDDEAGWLNGTTFPTWLGNSVVTAHVWDAFDQAGPFVDLNKLQWGDKVVIHLYGTTYTFEVRSKHTVKPDDMSLIEREEDYAWLNLMTCRGFDEESNVYQYRLFVRAVLVDVE